MANPKGKKSKMKKRQRRTHIKLQPPALVECPECLEPKKPHFACMKCGTYKGVSVLAVKEA